MSDTSSTVREVTMSKADPRPRGGDQWATSARRALARSQTVPSTEDRAEDPTRKPRATRRRARRRPRR
jgi:hypothetical protein